MQQEGSCRCGLAFLWTACTHQFHHFGDMRMMERMAVVSALYALAFVTWTESKSWSKPAGSESTVRSRYSYSLE